MADGGLGGRSHFRRSALACADGSLLLNAGGEPAVMVPQIRRTRIFNCSRAKERWGSLLFWCVQGLSTETSHVSSHASTSSHKAYSPPLAFKIIYHPPHRFVYRHTDHPEGIRHEYTPPPHSDRTCHVRCHNACGPSQWRELSDPRLLFPTHPAGSHSSWEICHGLPARLDHRTSGDTPCLPDCRFLM